MMEKEITEKIQDAELVLVGIGESFHAQEEALLQEAYQGLARLLAGKNYFIISTCTDDLILTADLKKERIVRPLLEEDAQWETYMLWLQGTLNKRLLVLELGVGLQYPNLIRFPFEKTVYFHQKAFFIRVHEKLFQLPAELNGRGISFQMDPRKLLTDPKKQF